MAGTLVTSGVVTHSSAAGTGVCVITIDANAEAGDVILIDFQIGNSTDSHSGTGGNGEWLNYQNLGATAGGGNSLHQYAYTVHADDTPGTTQLTMTDTTATDRAMQAGWEVWSGLDGSDLAGGSLIDVDDIANASFSTSHAAPDITTTADDETVRATWARASGAALSASDPTEVINSVIDGVRRLVTQYETQATAGATGTTSATSGANALCVVARAAYKNAAGGTPATATPAAIAASVTLPASTTLAGAIPTPAAVAASTTTPQATTAAGAISTPSAVAATGTLPAPSATGGATASPAATETAATLPAVSAAAGAIPTPAVIAVSATVPQASAIAGAIATPAAVDVVVTVPQASVNSGGSATAEPAAIACVVSLPLATATGGAAASPGAITAMVTLPQASATAGALANPAAMAVSVSMPATSVLAGAIASPAAIAATAAMAAVTVLGGAIASPEAITVSVSIPQATIDSGAPQYKPQVVSVTFGRVTVSGAIRQTVSAVIEQTVEG